MTGSENRHAGLSNGDVSNVVRYHQHGILPGFVEPLVASPPMLAADESDLVYHLSWPGRRTSQPKF